MKSFRSLWPPAQQVEPAGVPYRSTRRYRLESALPDTYFDAEIEAGWLAPKPGYDATVFHFLKERGSAETRRYSVLEVEEANDGLNMCLGAIRWPAGIELSFVHAKLTVYEVDRDFALNQAAIKRQAQAKAAELVTEHAYLARLRELFLCDSATAMLWWSNGDPDRVLRLVKEGEQFEALVGMVTRSPGSKVQPDRIAPIVASFLEDLGADHRAHLIGQLAKILENYHRLDLAEELGRSESPDISEGE
jgi:hypothetical protein